MIKTPIDIFAKYAEMGFKDIREFQRYLRRTEDIPDNVGINGILYTQDEYDIDGEYITYYNKRTDRQIRIDTANRYKSMKDAKVWLFLNYGAYRKGIDYLD